MEEDLFDVGGIAAGDDTAENGAVSKVDAYSTTPLHEAARLGAGDLVRFLLANGGDPNVRNGLGRTALHTCAGGLTAEEDQLNMALVANKKRRTKSTKGIEGALAADDLTIGLRATVIPDEIFALMRDTSMTSSRDSEQKNNSNGHRGGTSGMIRRLFGSNVLKNEQEEWIGDERGKKVDVKPDPKRLDTIVTERMDVTLALLSWVSQDSSEGLSINAVDADGRTALHYAAEMGRSDVCMAILSNYDVMLTIVDALGARTPCELAASQGHDRLAAQLEARALLYIDPYGLDDDLMDNLLEVSGSQEDPRARLVPPYKWFETTNLDGASTERSRRLTDAKAKILSAAEKYGARKDLSTVMVPTTDVGLDATVKDNTRDDDCVESAQDATNNDHRLQNEIGERQASMQALNSETDKGGSATDTNTGKSDCDVAKDARNACASDENLNASMMFQVVQDSDVERFMAYHKWDLSEATKAFRKDPVQAFKSAGISFPTTSQAAISETNERLCQICYDDDVEILDWKQLSGCSHGFCKVCLVDYIKNCSISKMPAYAISCPHHDCTCGLLFSDMEDLLNGDPDVLSHITDASTEQFIASARDFRFCTHPGCKGVVRRLPQPVFTSAGFDAHFLDYTGATCVAVDDNGYLGETSTLTYEGVEDLNYKNCRSVVQPRKAHRFCFACGDSVHWPVTCERLEEWKEKMREEIGEVEEEKTDADFHDLAQKMWLRANTRPCPMCNAPIEKNEGCNHVTCTNPSCLHEFCWICRKDWKLHGTNTGGFFRCNIWHEDESGLDGRNAGLTPIAGMGGIYDAEDQGYGTAIFAARQAWKKNQEMNRFLHHFSRFEAHGESSALERRMGDSVCMRLAPVVEAAVDFDGSPSFNFGGHGLSFIHSAFTELLECRSVLKYSYAFSYFRYATSSDLSHRLTYQQGRRKEKMTFERLQSELEMLTEQMSDIVARSHIRATQVQITFLTAGAAEKRTEFSNLVFQIFREEKKEISKQKQREQAEESTYLSDAGGTGSPVRRSRNSNTLSELLTMHQRIIDDDQVMDQELDRALDDFLARAGGVVRLPRRQDGDRNDGTGGVQMWECTRCTFMNSGGRRCAMCQGIR